LLFALEGSLALALTHVYLWLLAYRAYDPKAKNKPAAVVGGVKMLVSPLTGESFVKTKEEGGALRTNCLMLIID
jgi:hypothetical protein